MTIIDRIARAEGRATRLLFKDTNRNWHFRRWKRHANESYRLTELAARRFIRARDKAAAPKVLAVHHGQNLTATLTLRKTQTTANAQ
jgi:hypothetical protein